MKSAQGAGTKERDPAAPINGSSGPVLSPIPPAPLVEPAKRRRPIGFLAAAVVLAIAGGLGRGVGGQSIGGTIRGRRRCPSGRVG